MTIGPIYEDAERQVIWHDDPSYEALVRKLIADLKPDRFVETGTYKAGLTRWMADAFPDLPYYTVEGNGAFYHIARARCEGLKNVGIYNMLSPDFLGLMVHPYSGPARNGLTFFYLDAHSVDLPFPLRDECRVISALERYVCVIDDFNLDLERRGADTEINLNNVKDVMGDDPYVPAYPMGRQSNGAEFVGYALYLKGVEFEPPSFLRRAGKA